MHHRGRVVAIPVADFDFAYFTIAAARLVVAERPRSVSSHRFIDRREWNN